MVLRSLPEEEYIFPLSMPAGLPPEEQIQEAQFDNPEDVQYRQHLSKNYGKYKQMVSGVHYNFQLSTEFVEKAFALQTEYSELKAFQNALYMKLANNFCVINGFCSIYWLPRLRWNRNIFMKNHRLREGNLSAACVQALMVM